MDQSNKLRSVAAASTIPNWAGIALSVAICGLALVDPPLVLAQQHTAAPPALSAAQGSPPPGSTPTVTQPTISIAPPAVTVNVAPSPQTKSLITDSVPAILSALIGAVIAGLLAWTIGVQVTARWDIRKKRAEFDQQVVQEFHKVIAEFKAVGREREVLLARQKKQSQGGTGEEQSRLEEVRYDLIKRTVALESSLEAVLLKLVSDTESWLEVRTQAGAERDTARERQYRTMGLLRVAFRNLREELMEEEETTPPGFGDPQLWLFNRLASDLVIGASSGGALKLGLGATRASTIRWWRASTCRSVRSETRRA